jgi:D-psicose/D-tagatose/L-ribulose 3-epimerase
MISQHYEQKNEKIRAAFEELKKNHPEKLNTRLNLSWSNWGFGMEPLDQAAARLEKSGIKFIELHGNHYGPDLGYKTEETLEILQDHGIQTAGVCGMYSADSELSSSHASHRQAALDYIKREVSFTAAVGGSYLLVVPGAVGRPTPYDAMEFDRAVETLNLVTDWFTRYQVRGAVEPIRSEEVSFCHSVADAKRFIQAVNHRGVAHINGDVYHMQTSESHIGEAILDAGDLLINLHMADSNRLALGQGSLDLDTIIRALYLIGYNQPGRYVTPEPLGPGGNPYQAMNGKPDQASLDRLVQQTSTYFRQREEELVG